MEYLMNLLKKTVSTVNYTSADALINNHLLILQVIKEEQIAIANKKLSLLSADTEAKEKLVGALNYAISCNDTDAENLNLHIIAINK